MFCLQNQICSYKGSLACHTQYSHDNTHTHVCTWSSAWRLWVTLSFRVTPAHWAAWKTMKQTKEEKTRMSTLPPLNHPLPLLPETFLVISPLRPACNLPVTPLWDTPLYLGVYLSIHHSRPELSVRQRELCPLLDETRGTSLTHHSHTSVIMHVPFSDMSFSIIRANSHYLYFTQRLIMSTCYCSPTSKAKYISMGSKST